MGSTGDLIKVWPIETRGVLTDTASGLCRPLCNEYARFSDSRNIDDVKYRSQSSIQYSSPLLIPTRHQLSQCRTMSFGDAVDTFFFPFLLPEDASFHNAVPCRLATWLMHSSTLCHHTPVGHTNVWMSSRHRPTIWRSIGTDGVQQISPIGLRLWLPPCHWKTLQCYDSTHRRASPALLIVYSSPCCSSRHTYICEFP